MDLNLKQKKALVCASSRGLGFAAAEALAKEGCELFMCSRGEREINEAANNLHKSYGVPVHALAIDLAVPGSIATLKEQVTSRMGHADIVVNNVGGPTPSSAEKTSESAWRIGFDQLFMSAVTLSQAFVPSMKERGFGRILTITSISVVEPVDHLAVSTSMRLAVTGFAKTLATEVAPFGVTVNNVLPGIIHTQRIEDLRKAKAGRDGTTLADEMAKTISQIPAGRLGRPEELGALVAFLASPLASYITGANILVDGGMRKGF